MTKQEKIKEEWEIAMPGYIYYDNDGLSDHVFHESDFNCNNFRKLSALHGFYIRPITLDGIEDNNGWQKIEGDQDLPKENGMYNVYYKDGTISSRYYDVRLNDWNVEPKATHYQPIVKPKPPLY